MELRTTGQDQPVNQPMLIADELPAVPERRSETAILAQGGNGDCGCGGSAAGSDPIQYVYALGKVSWRFRSAAIEKEFAQVTGQN